MQPGYFNQIMIETSDNAGGGGSRSSAQEPADCIGSAGLQVGDPAGAARHPSAHCNACLVRKHLEASKRERQSFWRMLLVQAGLSAWLRAPQH